MDGDSLPLDHDSVRHAFSLVIYFLLFAFLIIITDLCKKQKEVKLIYC